MSSAELVATNTRDGIRLDGAMWAATGERQWDIDAAILLHGVGGNFYGGGLFDPLSDRLRARGVDVLRVNTRGHDGHYVAGTATGRRQLGAAFEIVDECRLDIAAWIGFLEKRQRAATESELPIRIALIGHSLGSVKAIYSQACEPDDRIAAVIAYSPARLSYELFMTSESREPFSQSSEEAKRMVADRRGEQLFQTKFPFPMLMSALAYLDKYGPKDRYDFVRYIAAVAPRTLLMFGELELASGGPAFAGVPDVIRGLGDLPATIEIAELAEADHFYTGVRDKAAESVAQWMGAQFEIER